MDYTFFAFLSIILLSTRIFGFATRKINLPAVVGALIAGILLGPSLLNWVKLDGGAGSFIHMAAEAGVVILMFRAGLDTDMNELKTHLPASVAVALGGILVPLLGGSLCHILFFGGNFANSQAFLSAVFTGVVLTATSVSVTVETLREMGKLNSRVGSIILGAAVLDDILGVIVLSVITGITNTSVDTVSVLLNMLWFALAIALLWGIVALINKYKPKSIPNTGTAIYALTFCFLLAFSSENVYGVADVTGAFLAGLILSTTDCAKYVDKRCGDLSDLFFSPIFFASIGLQVSFQGMHAFEWLFTLALFAVAVIAKLIGCGAGARLLRSSWRDSMQIGIGMICRGEIAIIMAQKGVKAGLMDTALFTPVVIVVIATTLITPILLKLGMKENHRVQRMTA